ncbi:MAG: hypothetical protein WB902_17640 [Acetobacteraceae bacterium]|jgi:hypothetical protein
MLPSHSDGHIEPPAAQQGNPVQYDDWQMPRHRQQCIDDVENGGVEAARNVRREMITVVMAKFSTFATSAYQVSYPL